jgi:drug/metabolite transporter (DMT)-like permease
MWATLCGGVEAAWTPGWSEGWTLDIRTALGLLFIAIGPSILAYRCWGLGVQAVGPTVAGFFSNLTPVFAALWSTLLLGQGPRWYHPLALVLIAAGILVSSGLPLRRRRAA